MLVDCRGLIEFCKSFEQHRNMANSPAILDTPYTQQQHKTNGKSKRGQQPLTPAPPHCEQPSAAAVDVIILFLVLAACVFLFTPYFRYLCTEAVHILPITLSLIGEVVYHAPVVYIAASLLTFAAVIGGCEYYQYTTRKCDNPRCKGLRKAMEFDIQLESERCVKSPASQQSQWEGSVELGEDHKELEAELKRMAPPNGRAVLVFRAPCGCPAARMEVRGSKKGRKLKKVT
eukprot:c20843_g1_i1 orf=483-1175(+)